MGELKTKTINGIAWTSIKMLSNRGLSFLFMIFMTRMLLPEDYGMVGMLVVFIAIATLFVDCGFGQALVRKENRTIVDESTVFFFNIIASLLCYLLLFFTAPLIGDFYRMHELTNILKILGLTLIISSLSSIHALIYTIELNFKVPSIIGVSSNLLAGVAGLVLAYNNFGVWSIVGQQILMALFTTVLYWFISKWRPKLVFSRKTFLEMFFFGSKLLVSRLINTVYHYISPIFIGRFYSASDLGLYTKAESITAFPASTSFGVLETVTYPVLCRFQSDKEKLTSTYRKLIRIESFVIFPIMVLIGVLAEPIMVVLFGEKWATAGIYMTLLSFPWMLVPIQCQNLNLLQVVGRSDLLLRLEILSKSLGVSMLVITLPISISAMCYGTIVTTTLCLFINTYYTSRFISLSVKNQMMDIARSLFLTIVMGAFVYFISIFFERNILKIFVGGAIGLICYLGIAWIFKMSELKEIMDLLKKR